MRLKINDNHFYMETRAGVLDFLVENTNENQAVEVRLTVKGALPGLHGEACLALGPADTARRKIQVTPTVAGEHLLQIWLCCARPEGEIGLVGETVLKVLAEEAAPASVQIVVDQSMRAHGGSKIGFGQNVQSELSESLAKGLIRSVNDLLREEFPDHWQEIPLMSMPCLPDDHDKDASGRRRRVVPDPFPGNPKGGEL